MTLLYQFLFRGLTDVVSDKICLATRRNALRINDQGICQYFLEERLFEHGKTHMDYDGTTIAVYSLERMLIELMRNSASMPLDYYKEIISSYRKRIDDMDVQAVEEYMDLFERNDYMFDIFQKEVL
jgi:hypothetical protein